MAVFGDLVEIKLNDKLSVEPSLTSWPYWSRRMLSFYVDPRVEF